jgi:hypothetical protein
MKIKLFLLACFIAGSSNLFAQSELSNAVRQTFSNSFYATFAGNTKAKLTNDRSLVVTIGSDENNMNEHQRAFLLTAESAPRYHEFESGDCEFFVTTNQTVAIIVNNADQTVSLIGLDNDETKAVKNLLEENALIASHFSGNNFFSYGISFIEGKWSLELLSKSKYKNPFNYLASGDLTGKFAPENLGEAGGGYVLCEQGSCTSGGAGSSTCSISEEYMGVKQACSVSCNTGYYACCNTKAVRCFCCKIARD